MPRVNLDFLKALLTAAAPSGCEARASAIWTQEAQGFADHVHEDHYGNVYAEINPPAAGTDSQPIVLMGHIDEIGLMVSHIDDKGMLAFMGVGGWDPQVLVGQRIRLLADEGDILGVIGKKAIHVMEGDERSKASKLEDLWIDTALDVEEVKRRISVGTVGVIEQPPLEVNGHLISKALDNRAGAFVVLEALRAMKAAGVTRHVVAVGTSQEEIGCFGAQVSGYRLNPSAGVVVDVTHETNQPGVNEKKYGVVPFGSGANLAVGSMVNPVILRQMKAVAAKTGVAYTLSANPRYTGTDNDTLALVRTGVPAAVVSIPNRYMHSPNEMVRLSDVQACIDIIAGWVGSLDGEQDYTRR
uniref:M20/M25/M40 family metallo-hydrolase n=1 Tax=Deinococcus ruber TaxID=1848197 RepID=UPI001E6009C9|nr:M20/M25/M40 family metallo-hydrolase [Deinococcus ruber]